VIVIVDYGVGNVASVLNMLRKVGAKARVSGAAADMEGADKLILPGIGHFGHGMRKLAESGLVPTLREQALVQRKPILGICLGMQMMTRGSEESDVPGLAWLDAFTHRFSESPGRRVPHMGWNSVRPGAHARLFDHDPPEPERFYFVHSYFVRVADPTHTAASCRYGDEFTAAFEHGNLFGVQFHPEKSHLFGMSVLTRFASV
jgi:imidazole glycerol-phosphate synthase subunit HisH